MKEPEELKIYGLIILITSLVLLLAAFSVKGWQQGVVGFCAGVLIREGWDWFRGKNRYL